MISPRSESRALNGGRLALRPSAAIGTRRTRDSSRPASWAARAAKSAQDDRATVDEMPDAALAVYHQVEYGLSQVWQVRGRYHDVAGRDHFAAS